MCDYVQQELESGYAKTVATAMAVASWTMSWTLGEQETSAETPNLDYFVAIAKV